MIILSPSSAVTLPVYCFCSWPNPARKWRYPRQVPSNGPDTSPFSSQGSIPPSNPVNSTTGKGAEKGCVLRPRCPNTPDYGIAHLPVSKSPPSSLLLWDNHAGTWHVLEAYDKANNRSLSTVAPENFTHQPTTCYPDLAHVDMCTQLQTDINAKPVISSTVDQSHSVTCRDD